MVVSATAATAGARICYEGQGRTQPGRPRHAAREMQRTVVSHDVCVSVLTGVLNGYAARNGWIMMRDVRYPSPE